MSAADASARARRRARRAHELRDEGWSQREIARDLRVSPSTVHGYLVRPCPEPHAVANLHDQDGRPVAGATTNNTRALKHGAASEQAIVPLREKHARQLRETFDWLDDRRLALLADRLARIESGSEWMGQQGGVVRDSEGEVYPVVDRIEKWSTTAERVLAELYAEDRQRRGSAPDVTAYLAGLDDEDDQGDGDEESTS